ncbi:hypothetical protein D3C71_631700 [compost metagenome]
MHETDCIDCMQEKPLRHADILVRESLVIIGIGICDAAAAGWNIVQAAFVKRLQENRQCSGLAQLLDVKKLVRRTQLSGGDHVLNLGHHERDNGERLADAGRLRDHTLLHDLRFDLPETRNKITPSCLGRHENARRTQHRVEHVSDAEGKLLYGSGNAGVDNCLVQFHLCLGQSCFGALLLRRQKDIDLRDESLLLCHRGAESSLSGLNGIRKPLNFPPGNGILCQQLDFHFVFVDSNLQGALRLLYL